jgi:hypothetical protein
VSSAEVPLSLRASVEGTRMTWNEGEGSVRPVSLDRLGQRYRRYRLVDADAETAMAGSLRRWGQLAALVACVRQEKFEVLDGFKRLAAARSVGTARPRRRSWDSIAVSGRRGSWKKPGSCRPWCAKTA